MQDFWQILSSTSAFLYVIIATIGLVLLWYQLVEMTKIRKIQTLTSIFDSFQTIEARRARKYIHSLEPVLSTEITLEQLDNHLDKIWEAIAPFDRIGYFLKKEMLHEEDVVSFMWAIVWTSWQKSKSIIMPMREKRNDPTYRIGFEYFFEISEKYRRDNNYEEPR